MFWRWDQQGKGHRNLLAVSITKPPMEGQQLSIFGQKSSVSTRLTAIWMIWLIDVEIFDSFKLNIWWLAACQNPSGDAEGWNGESGILFKNILKPMASAGQALEYLPIRFIIEIISEPASQPASVTLSDWCHGEEKEGRFLWNGEREEEQQLWKMKTGVRSTRGITKLGYK